MTYSRTKGPEPGESVIIEPMRREVGRVAA